MTHSFPFARLGIAHGLLAVSIVVHASFLALAFRWLLRKPTDAGLGDVRAVWMLVQIAVWTVLAHLIEIAIWAAAYVGLGVLPNFEVATYFSMVTYTTVGYGDVVLPVGWHLLSGVEGLTGILMAGWSTGFFFSVANRTITRRARVAGPPD